VRDAVACGRGHGADEGEEKNRRMNNPHVSPQDAVREDKVFLDKCCAYFQIRLGAADDCWLEVKTSKDLATSKCPGRPFGPSHSTDAAKAAQEYQEAMVGHTVAKCNEVDWRHRRQAYSP